MLITRTDIQKNKLKLLCKVKKKKESSNDMLTAMQILRNGGSMQYLQCTGRNPVIGFKTP